jgi:membrane protein DedA with SNARE-associated domain
MAGWIESLVNQTSYLGVALLMLLENVFPPIPSELIMPLAGHTASQGRANIVLVVIAGSVGSLAGAVFWYLVGHWLGGDRLKLLSRRHGRWLTLTPQDIDHASDWFGRHGAKAVFVGRLIPTVRTLISIPAGICGMPWTRFLLYSSLGTAVWTAALALAGYALGSQYQTVGNWVGPVSNGIFAVIVACYLYRVVTFRRRVEA